MSNDELTLEQETRVSILQGGGDAIHRHLLEQLGVDYTIVILVCPKGSQAITIAGRAVSLDEVKEILAVANNTAGVGRLKGETLQ